MAVWVPRWPVQEPFFTDAIPKNPSGQLLKRELRQRHITIIPSRKATRDYLKEGD